MLTPYDLYDLVSVTWDDHWGYVGGDAISLEDLKHLSSESLTATTIGFLVHETDSTYTLGAEARHRPPNVPESLKHVAGIRKELVVAFAVLVPKGTYTGLTAHPNLRVASAGEDDAHT